MNRLIGNSKRRKITGGIIFWLWVAGILFLSLTPQAQNGQTNGESSPIRIDYLQHFIAYFILAVLFYIWKSNNKYQLRNALVVIFLAGGLAFAGISEVLQIYLSSRTCNPVDFIFNALGILTGIVLSYLLIPNIRKRINKLSRE
jgi:VanZ family protein